MNVFSHFLGASAPAHEKKIAQNFMAELVELTEYLYGESHEVQYHGLKQITSFLLNEFDMRGSSDYEPILRIMLRLAAEETDISCDASVLELGIINLLLLESGNDSVKGAISSIVVGQLESGFTAEYRSEFDASRNDYVHLGLLLICSQPRSVWDPSSPLFARVMKIVGIVLTKSSVGETLEVCLRFVKNMSVIAETHGAISEVKLVTCIQGCLRRGSSRLKQASLEALYNMSFNKDFLHEMALSDFFDLISDFPLAVRILINAYSIVPRMTRLLLGAECTLQVLSALVKGENSRELLMLLQAVAWQTEVFSDSLQDVLLSLLSRGIQLEDPFMIDALLLFRPMTTTVPEELRDRMMFSLENSVDETYKSSLLKVACMK